jgi:hypothetical protein
MKTATSLIAIVALFSISTIAQDLTLKEVLVGNEGNFTAGNATITQYDFGTQTATDGFFFNANGVGLGDVVQSITEIDDELYIVVNNSQKIVIVNPETFVQTGLITFGVGASPREIVAVGDNKAYVTDLFGNYLNVVDLSTKSVTTDTIRVGSNPDKMLLNGNHVYVSNNGFGSDSTIFKVDISTDSVIDTIVVNRGPASLVAGPQNSIWVVSQGYSGDFDDNFNLIPGTSLPGGVSGFDAATGEVITTIELARAGEDIGISENLDELFVNSGGIRKVFTNNMDIASDTLIPGNFYSFSYDAVGNRFFVSDAKTFSSAGEVSYYDGDGSLLGAFDTGIIPGDIHFTYEMTTSAELESSSNVENFRLAQNYPNPFNPSTKIEFTTPQNGNVKLAIYSITGQYIATLVDGYLNNGTHSVTFDGSTLASGLYIYRLWNGTSTITKTMTLIK